MSNSNAVTYPFTSETTSEDWNTSKTEITHLSATSFVVNEYEFRVGKVNVIGDEGDSYEFTEVFSVEHGLETPIYKVSRDLNPSKYSDGDFHSQDGDIERQAKTLPEVIAKLVAMCF